MASCQQETSPLLRLPPELRNRIYHALLCPTEVDLSTFELTEDNLSPPILRTSRQLRGECTGMFYANTILSSSDPRLLIKLLASLPQKVIDLILEIRYDTSETCVKASSWRTAFRELPGLDEDTKLDRLREEMKRERIELRVGVLKARIVVGCRDVWSSDPLSVALDAVKQGKLIIR